MILQKMEYENGVFVCAVNAVENGGEYTVCGNVNFDSGIGEDEEFRAIGQRYTGKLKDVTCPKCKHIIDYIKSFV